MAQTLIRKGQLKTPIDITNADIATGAAIDSSKLADGANFLKRDGSVALTGNLNANNNKITGLADPTSAQDAATKAYVDSVSTGLDVKGSVKAATTANITLTGTQTIDGVALSVGDRVLVKDQSTGSANGIYVVASGAWTRATDADSSAEVTPGMFTFVEQGTVNADSGWVLTTDGAVTLGTTALTFNQFSGAGQISAGAGLTKSGNTIDVVGTANRIVVNADSIDIASTYVGQTSITTLGTIATGTWQGTQIADAYLASISGSKVTGNITGNAANVTGTVAVANGGTGATTAAGARTNLGLVIGTDVQAYDGDLAAIAALAGTSGFLKKTAANTWALDTATYLTGNQTITLSGDASGSGSTAITVTLANSGVTAGTYRSVTVDAKGRVTAGTNPTTLSGYGIVDAQPLDADLTAIAALAGTSGFLKKTAADTWTLDTNTYLTSANAVTSFSGGTTGLTPATSSVGAVTLAGTLNVANGGTGATTAAGARTNLGATTVGANFFTATNPSAVTFVRVNADNTVSFLDAATFRTAIGAGTGTGTVTSVAVAVPTGLSVSGSPITSSGTITISYAAGYAIPTTTKQTQWDSAYSTSLVALRNDKYVKEVLTPAPDGSNTVFNLSQAPIGDTFLSVYVNGILQNEGAGNDYTLTALQVTFTYAPAVGDVIIAKYFVA